MRYKLLEEDNMRKLWLKLIGQEGNDFNIIMLISNALKEAGQEKEEKEFISKVLNAGSYDKSLVLCHHYLIVLMRSK